MARTNRQRLTAGLVLILVGLGFYLLQRVEGIGDEVVLLVIGTAFLIAYFYQRAYGLLIPAGILMGLGVGEVLDGAYWQLDGSEFGLGLGFIGIYVVARVYQGQSHWWPLIPGGILVLVGLPRTGSVFRYLFENWPLILVIIGVLILVGAFRRSGSAPTRHEPPKRRVTDQTPEEEKPVE